jgi:phosphoketolase
MTPASTDVKRKAGDGRKAVAEGPLTAEELRKMHAYWRAANYLSVGQIYLMDNPLLKEPLRLAHIKPRLLGHWGTTAAYFKQALRDKLIDHKHYICKHGDDLPEIAGWRWGQQVKAGGPRVTDTAGDNV